MKISVVTPLFNQAEYLPVCLRSVSMQRYKNVEHIVVDGGSTDGGVESLQTFQKMDSRLRFISEPDEGQGDAVNKGFALAIGDIVAWINSDDFYFSPTVFETVCGLFSKHPEIDILYGGMAWVDLHGNLKHIRIQPRFDWHLLTQIAFMGNTNTFLRRGVIDKHVIDKRFHYVLDHEYLLRVTREFVPLRTSKILGCFRVHPEAKTQTMELTIKNTERRLRDRSLGINRKQTNKYHLLFERILYRLALLKSDAIYLTKFRNNPPYKIFLAP